MLIKPVLNVFKNLFGVDMGHVVVLGQLLAEEGFSSAGFANEGGLEGLEAALLAELLFDQLNVGGEATFAVPVEVSFVCWGLLRVQGCLSTHEERRGVNLNV